MIYILWIIGIFLCSVCLLLVNRSMISLQLYLLNWLMRSLVLCSLTLLSSVDGYWYCYWPLQGVGYMLSALVAISLIKSTLSDTRRLIDLQTIACLVVALPFMSCMWQLSWHPWLAVAKWTDLAIVWMLLYTMVAKEMKQPYLGLAMGLIIGMLAHVCCALVQGDHDPAHWLRLLYQGAGILQLGIWAWTLESRKLSY